MQGTDHLNRRLSAAVETIARAERLHQYFLKLRPRAGVREPCWEPPIDVLETDREVLILIALPGVDPEQVQGVIEEGVLVAT